MDEKIMANIMQEEREKLLTEVKKKAAKRKSYMHADEPETGFENFKRK